MSVRVMALVWDSTVPAPARFTLLALADRADENGRCWPSIPLLARKCQTTENTTRAHLKTLEKAGLIMVSHRSGTSSVYTIDVDQLLAQQHIEAPAEVRAPPPKSGGPPKSAPPPKSGGNPPQNLQVDPPQNLGVTPPKICTQSISDPSTDPSVIHQTRAGARQPDPPGFDDFWAAYPRRVAKPDAKKAWVKAMKATPPESIVAGAKRYARERKGEDPQFTAYPATWLNRQSWSDETTPRQAGTNGYQPWTGPTDQSAYDEDL